MNIFVTNTCPIQSAKDHCAVHQRKIIVELAQMLSTAHHVHTPFPDPSLYKQTHINHPSNIWIRESQANYLWAYEHFKALCGFYKEATSKTHATEAKLLRVLSQVPSKLRGKDKLTPFAKAMPPEYKGISSDATLCYQKYLNAKYSEWLSRDKPIKVEFVVDTPSWLCKNVIKLIDNMNK